MKTLASNKKLVVEFNGSSTYFISSVDGHCYKCFNSEKRAMKYFEKLSIQMGA